MSYIAFEGSQKIDSGDLKQVVSKTKQVLDKNNSAPILIFDESNSQIVEVDFRGTEEEVLQRLNVTTEEKGAPLAAETSRKPGRPKLGVTAREVTLLPRHWDWLSAQPGSASVTLRKLVEQARRSNADQDLLREKREAAYRFMSTMAGNESGFEEATRALFAGDEKKFKAATASWPTDVREHSNTLATSTFKS